MSGKYEVTVKIQFDAGDLNYCKLQKIFDTQENQLVFDNYEMFEEICGEVFDKAEKIRVNLVDK